MTPEEASRLVKSLFLSWYSSSVRYAYRLCGSVEVAEDAVQSAFQSLYLALIDGKQVIDPKRWTLCVVRRNIGKYHRGQRLHGEQLLPVEEFDEMPDPRAQVEPDELTELFGVLTSREEEVLLLRMNGLRYKEIAEDLGI
ncbi:MAG: sigma-70 family RNA polymerase sigma factor, partial [bacterium]|nr:sigma-70 family RNA polymerase sigma factor [bacterium]